METKVIDWESFYLLFYFLATSPLLVTEVASLKSTSKNIPTIPLSGTEMSNSY